MKRTKKNLTMTEIAQRIGVSQATVSLVLNEAPGTRISPATREKVLNVAREMGYRRTPHSEANRGVIGVLINEMTTSQHLASLLEGIRDEAAQNDCLVTVLPTQADPEIEAAALSHLLSRPLRGVIYATLLTRAVTPPERLRNVPTVLLNCHYAKSIYPSVVPGDLAGGYAATATLLKAGHRRIAMINSEDWIEAARDRLQGYRQALTTYDIALDPELIRSGSWTQGSCRAHTHALLDLPSPPTALFCYCDRMAMGAYEAIKARGLRIPGDISVVGFDDEAYAQEMDPPLTTLVLPHDEMARWAVTRLLDREVLADGEHKYRKLKMECTLIPRASVAPPARPVGGRA